MGCAGSKNEATEARPGKTAPSGFNRERPTKEKAEGEAVPEDAAAAPVEEAAEAVAGEIDEFNQIQLDAHNEHRANHGAPAVVWCADLAKQAQEWAEKMVADGDMKHSGADERPGQGENLAMYGSSDPNDKTLTTTAFATNAWYDEVKDYDFDSPGFKSGTGHFTQVVWKSCTKVGFGTAGNYVVGRYGPPGNMEDAYEENVLPKQ